MNRLAHATVTIAFIAPLTGGEAVVALPMLEAVRRGAQRAASELGVGWQVLALDDRREPDRAVSLVRDLLADTSVAGVVGPKNSGSARAAAAVVRDSDLCLVLPAATGDDLCLAGAGRVFRLCARDADTATAAAALCRSLGAHRLLVSSDHTAYGVGLGRAVEAAARREGLEWAGDLGEADAAFFAMGEVEQAEAIKAARARGFAGLLMGAEGGPNAALPKLAGEAAEGALELYAGSAVADASCVYAPECEDAAWLLVHAAVTGSGRAGVCGALCDVDVVGSCGPLAFGPDGERRGAAVTVWRVVDRRSVPLAPHLEDAARGGGPER